MARKAFARAAWSVALAMALAVSVPCAAAETATAAETAAAAEPGPSHAEKADVRKLGQDDLRRLEAALAAAPGSLPLRMDRLRVLYVLSVRDEGLIAEGRRELDRLKAMVPGDAGPLLQAYRGAFRVLDAKHAAWPPRKLDHLKAGLPALDSAVSSRPEEAEIRYLRLVSCYYLPFFIGRKRSVEEDFAVLARLLPEAHGNYPARWYVGFARFVLEKGSLEEGQRRVLAARVAELSASEPAAGKGSRP